MAVSLGDSRDILEAGLVVAHVPLHHGDPGAGRKFLGALVIAGIIGDDRAALFLQRKADRFANTPGSTRHHSDTCHSTLSPVFLILFAQT